ncbi:hypothetical protein FPOA_06331 [Fusarium poae]|uniref:Arginase n=1 Tax=Fusarium poae TaxID=36050 RepID=A0A1B8AZ62_FUSPO|nr:hypothetical protein FPOA_06331 [Fusarium poae]
MAASPQVSILYVPADCGSIAPGKFKAPKAFQEVGIASKLGKAGVPSVMEMVALDSPVTCEASTHCPERIRNEEMNIAVCISVECFVSVDLQRSGTPQHLVEQWSLHPSSLLPWFQLIIGGECCMLPAILSAHWKHAGVQSPEKRVGLIYIDADTELTSPTDPSSTGTFVGTTMAHLLRLPGALPLMQQFTRPSGEPVCDYTNTVLFGTNMHLPGNKPEHFQYLSDNYYKVISSDAVAKSPEHCATEALEYLDDVDVIMVHLDVDSIDPGTFPLANVPNFTGVEFEEMMRALKILLRNSKVGGLVVTEVNPDHDPGLFMIDRLAGRIADMLGERSVIMTENH